ncbi:MAG: cytochrome C assembly protein [Bacteroidetes bacterium 4572_128]|nr:MAG: cytochrome C assembly protein [Bacteroidetes bacterium 4572_128]
MNWINFSYFAYTSIFLWLVSIVFLNINSNTKKNKILINTFSVLGTLIMSCFIFILWKNLERPPMRTLGETRLWYAFFLPVVGQITYLKWKYKWFLTFSLFLSIVFVLINILNTETHDKTLMPALQSIWFVPHVIVYIFSYALLAASAIVSLKALYEIYFTKINRKTMHLADNLVYIGFAFLTMGLLFGALWAKKAWGHYWTWDPKETWSFITWMAYLSYIHYRYHKPKNLKTPIWMLALAFVFLIICWFGINYLPTSINSVHTYTN